MYKTLLGFGGTFAFLFLITVACQSSTPTSQPTIVVTPSVNAACPYKLPWPNFYQGITLVQGNQGTFSHNEGGTMEYAYDFIYGNYIEGGMVIAAREGVVKYIETQYATCGNEKQADEANYVVIDHEDDTSALYLHLLHVVVEENQEVVQGQLLGYGGSTGWTGCDAHLHFQVQDDGSWFEQSVDSCFQEYPNGIEEDTDPVSQNQLVLVESVNITADPSETTSPKSTNAVTPSPTPITLSSDWILGHWEGEITNQGEGPTTITHEVYDIIKNCSGSEYCMTWSSYEDAPGPYVTGDQPPFTDINDNAVCFTDEFVYYFCFERLTEYSANLFATGPLWGAHGVVYKGLHQMPAGTEVSIPTLMHTPKPEFITEIEYYVPSVIPENIVQGFCWSTSLMSPREGAWRCFQGSSQIIDPCFSIPGEDAYVICDVYPDDEAHGFRLALSQPLPEAPTNPDIPAGLYLITEDDVKCRPLTTGTMFMVENKPIMFGCDNDWVVLDTPHVAQVWTVVLSKITPDFSEVLETKEVRIKNVIK